MPAVGPSAAASVIEGMSVPQEKRVEVKDMAVREGQSSLLQPSLLQGFPDRTPASGPPLAEDNPVARVVLESGLPHLDRPFDYSVPAELSAAAVPGVRVKVKFNGQELNGYLVERRADSDAAHPLTPLHKVVSGVAVLDSRSPRACRHGGRPVRRNVERCPPDGDSATGCQGGEGTAFRRRRS